MQPYSHLWHTLSCPLPILVKLKVTKLSVACSAIMMMALELLMQHIGGKAACGFSERAMLGSGVVMCCDIVTTFGDGVGITVSTVQQKRLMDPVTERTLKAS